MTDQSDALRMLTGEGWDSFATPEQEAAAQVVSDAEQERRSLERYDDDCILRDTFTQGSGPAALKILIFETIEQPCFMPEITINSEQFGFMREGQNSIVRSIIKRIKRAELGPPTVNKPEPEPEDEGD